MFHETMMAAIDAARTLARADDLSKLIWQGHGAGALDDTAAQTLAELIEVKRGMIRERIVPVGIPAGRATLFPPRRPVASPDRLASRDRRRLLAASGPMPPALAARFTTGQLAALRIVGDEIAAKGVCGLCIDAIAARAGVCRRLAQTAIRLAAGDGLITVQERRHQGRKSDPNLIRMISREWSAWLRRARRSAEPATAQRPIGCKDLRPSDTQVQKKNRRPLSRSKESAGIEGAGSYKARSAAGRAGDRRR
ncbi:hypothetical protein [Methylobacterium sp. J-092]|uniref:hypothetical protein n=1 Tax=Methylobacterium sp. J-092 TaxID=2836667 RepID=UPI001FBAB6EA|nr:hypothetical protein [Methylobacterium sp. J-092]MCJ2009175.1 hypothetical protein [Methylobacterium sp. J-092]